ncbi:MULTISPECIES: substrate-binding domain-containing protein [unclassified Corynebacterium]|uniref:substrate-binding domain-containing protein n=1 Tax=unclassified Corynebacterium TaxID=2624378 RepID=UPI001EF6F0A9|nr:MULTISPECIES: substrate-binding domain-containing protein [unclassified Corynebacterium]MCG7289408.1 substrate-binding domain-containing protein [Corynebacterium sp. ACRPZ]MCG7293674.1 substrate-binding domain-containing protein [Corynebacterium sp. ACRPY]
MRKRLTATAALAAVAALAVGCGNDTTPGEDVIKVTGSSTVEPITSYMANRYDFDVDIDAVGSTDGFEAFCAGEADINDSSVAIPGSGADVDYQKQCADTGVNFIELPIALDAITLVKHRDNDWAEDLTIQQLHDIWAKDSAVTKWSDIDPSWPDEEITLYGRPDGSGTLGVFEQLVLDGDEIREDYQATDDIQELSKWVSEDVNGLSFMGIGNYLATEDPTRNRIDNVLVDGVAPTADEAKSGNYPLARPLFIYVNEDSAKRDDVDEFVTTYLDKVEAVLPRVYFYQLQEDEYDKAKKRYEDRETGADERWQ